MPALGPGQFQLNEFHRSSEPLQENFTRVLAENLRRLLPNDQVIIFPWRRLIPNVAQVEVTVDRFHVTQYGESILEAQWQIIHEGKVQLVKSSSYLSRLGK